MDSYSAEHANLAGRSIEEEDEIFLAHTIIEGGFAETLGVDVEAVWGLVRRPACPVFVANLPRMTLEQLQDKEGQCTVCLSSFATGDETAVLCELPCKHVFHEKCIVPWFKLCCSCPVCRAEIPSNDPLYEEYKRRRARTEAHALDIEELHNLMFS